MFLAAALALTLAFAPEPAATAPPAGKAPSQIAADALIRLQAHLDVADKAMGEDQAEALGSRLADDLDAFNDPTIIPGYTQAAYEERLRSVATLDASIVDQVLSARPEPLAGVHGLAERLIKSTTDGTWQPVAIYVPQQTKADANLVVLLHGQPQTETNLLGAPYFQTLAESTNSIVAAPWGRGNYDFYGIASDDVYQTADDVAKAYGIDRRRIYLAGYSMGGFSVFKIGPTHGDEWRAVLCIAGSVLNSEAASVLKAWKNTPIYVVNGKLDQSIPPIYGEKTADWLAGSGIPTSFYQEPKGTHYIPTLMPSLTQAWRDMIAGVVRNTPAVSQDGENSLPGAFGSPDVDKRPPG
jgi:predicted esterase